MINEIINRILVLIFFLCSLNTLREAYFFLQTFFKEEPTPFKLTRTQLILLGLSVAYILTTFVVGIKL